MERYIDIEVSELLDMQQHDDIVLLDVRNDDEVARGRIPHAQHVALAALPIELNTFLQEKRPIVIYCHSGIRSAQAAAYLTSKGCSTIYNLRGGVLAWGRAGQALV